jgi:F-type H+-transporting ATPase subunit epsilon
MRLKVILPAKILVDEEVSKVIAEAEDGSFCLLPRHADFVTSLAPGILIYEDPQGEESFLAVDLGILVKSGAEVLISTRNAVLGSSLQMLQKTVEAEYLQQDEQQRATSAAVARLEAAFMRRFLDQETTLGG